MESKINIVRKELRALKKSSRVIKRLIEAQGIHYKRIEALCKMEENEKIKALILREKEIISALGIDKQIEKSASLEEKYIGAINALSPSDKAMMLDCFLNGMPYWRLGMEYGFAEEGARKHIEALVKKIAEM